MSTSVKIDNFINNSFVACRRYIDSYDPSTGNPWAKIPDSGKLEVEAAVAAAKRAFPGWSETPIAQRAQIMFKIADLLEEKCNELAETESRDQGKPVWLAKNVDIPRAIKNFRHFAETGQHILGTSKILGSNESMSYTTYNPIGVVGLISPWNLPLYLLTFKIAPALISGNTVVAKPSEMTSVTTHYLCEILAKAGLPEGVVNVVYGYGAAVGEEIVVHPDVPVVSFTGSTATGRNIAIKAAPMFKKLSLEMGGKNPSVVFADCDIKKAVACHIRSSFINNGQVCLCTSRIFVQKQIFEEFLNLFIESARKLKVGPPTDDVFNGALNSKGHYNKVKSYIDLAVSEGVKIECGETVDRLPNMSDHYKNGYYLLPTIITGVSDDSRLMKEEIFGPVTCVVPFETEEEAIRRANNTEYGLCATVWTSNLGTAHRVASKIEAGTVWINCWLVRDMDLPFGGMKQSGCGREGTMESFEFFTEKKCICANIEP